MVSVAELLNVWERGQTQPTFERALLLLHAVYPERSPEELAQLSIGHRDSLLLEVRERFFGGELSSMVACPQCNEEIELQFAVRDILLPVEDKRGPAAAEPLQLSLDGYQVRFRLPTSADLRAMAAHAETNDLDVMLLDRCILTTMHEGQPVATGQLPDAVSTAITTAMADADPHADIQLAVNCPTCARQWLANFDITTFLWAEITAWAGRLLHEVHLLASAYGWREADILALSPMRRQAYLELSGAA